MPSAAARLAQRKGRLAALASLLVLAALVYGRQFDAFQIGSYIDDAVYAIAARAVAQGAVEMLWRIPFPPAYPLLLAPIASWFPDNLEVLRVPSFLLTLAALPVWFKLLRRRIPFWAAYLIIAAVALNPAVVGHSSIVMSDALFFFVLGVLLLVAERVEAGQSGVWGEVGAGLLLMLLFLTRTAGAAFLLPLAAAFLLARRVRAFLIFAVTLGSPIAYWLHEASAHGHVYLREFVGGGDGPLSNASMVARLVESVRAYALEIVPGALAVPIGQSSLGVLQRLHLDWMRGALAVALLLLLVVGAIVEARRGRALSLALLLYLGTLLVYPFPSDRYLYPVLPLLYFFVFSGVSFVVSALRRQTSPVWGLRAGGVAVGLLLVLSAVRVGVGALRPPPPRLNDLTIGTTWIADHAPPVSYVMAEHPWPRYLYTKRGVVAPARDDGPDASIADAIVESQASYVFIAPPIQAPPTLELSPWARGMERVMKADPERFPLAFAREDANVRVYAVAPNLRSEE